MGLDVRACGKGRPVIFKDTPIGFLRIDCLTFKQLSEEQFKAFFPLSEDSMGVDVQRQEPIEKTFSGGYDLTTCKDLDGELVKQAYWATVSLLDWLKRNGILHEVVLHYKLRRDLLDYQVICEAYEVPEDAEGPQVGLSKAVYEGVVMELIDPVGMIEPGELQELAADLQGCRDGPFEPIEVMVGIMLGRIARFMEGSTLLAERKAVLLAKRKEARYEQIR